VDRKLVDKASVEILLNDISASSDSYVFVPSGFSGLSNSTLDTIVHEIESSAAGTFPRLANLVSQNEHRCVEGRFFRPELLSSVEHALSHDTHSCAVEGLF